MGINLTEKEIYRADTSRFERELGLLVSGELIIRGDDYLPPEDGGEFAELTDNSNPPNEGGEAKSIPRHSQEIGELALAHAA